jgi:hypothetical protein
MEDDDAQAEAAVKEVEELLRSAMPNKIVSNFILIAEIVEEEGQSLSLAISDSMTPWLAYGMLNGAMGMVSSGEYQFPINDEEQYG